MTHHVKTLTHTPTVVHSTRAVIDIDGPATCVRFGGGADLERGRSDAQLTPPDEKVVGEFFFLQVKKNYVLVFFSINPNFETTHQAVAKSSTLMKNVKMF